jgi:hypothetical protein
MEQLQALALLFLKVNDHAAAIGMAFFGFSALLKGCLIVRSTFLYQPLGYRLFPYIPALGLLGAVPQILWLLVFGVHEQRWKEQARAAGTGA